MCVDSDNLPLSIEERYWLVLARPRSPAQVSYIMNRFVQQVLHRFATFIFAELCLSLGIAHVLADDLAAIALNRYCDDGRLAIDNHAAERALRGIAVG